MEGRLDEFGTDTEIKVDVVELRSDAAALKLDVVETAAHLGPGLSRALGGEVEQVLFFGVESFQPAVQLPAQEHRGSALIGDGLTHGSSSLSDEVGAELHFDEVLSDVPLDVGNRDRPSTAGLVLGAGTEEVEVLAAPSDAAVEEQAPFTTLVVAAAAPQQSLEEVVVHSFSFATCAAGSEDVLHSLEQLVIDERLMTSLELLALVGQEAEVVAVGQHLADLGNRDRSGGSASRLPGAQASVGEFVSDPFERVVAGGVQLEG